MMPLVHFLKWLNLIPVPLADIQPQICRARALIEANNAGVFAALEESRVGLTSDEVADRVGISREGAEVLLTALEKAGYLRKRRGRYRNGRWVKRWITDASRGLSNFLKLQNHTWMRLGDLGVPLSTGRAVEDYHELEVAKHSERQEIYSLGMREIARLFTPEFVKKVSLPQGAQRLLDVGGAHGDYSRALIRKFPGLRATIVDLAGPIATAERVFKDEGGSEDIELRVGDAFKDDLGTGWDAVLLANMVHLFDHAENRNLLERVYNVLNVGGTVIVLDQFQGMGRLQDRVASLLAVNYFTVGGKCYHVDEIRTLLQGAGFEGIKLKRFLLNAPTALLQGWK